MKIIMYSWKQIVGTKNVRLTIFGKNIYLQFVE